MKAHVITKSVLHCQCPADSNVLTQVLLQQPGEDRVSVGDEVALPLLVALLQRTEQQLASQSVTHADVS